MVPGYKTENNQKNIQHGRQIQDCRQNIDCHIYFLPFDLIALKSQF